jgi:diaminohydroxyphosphoribosylaminopyrimidine deaminase/5-amino-6-(5-phosphoribosylamino)uracil reductase
MAAMRRAIVLAGTGLGATSPNPVVGAVVLDVTGEVVGEGFHARAGAAHAEVGALRAAGDRARGGTCVVTLEPCAHTGRTPPCTDALVAAGIARVVFAVADPNPQAAGGAAVLRGSGIDVEGGVLAAEAEWGNEAWLRFVRCGRPFVTWKYAAGLDGRTAAADGSSRWITSGESRLDVHRLRGESDAVLVGSRTVLIDDPHLAVRKGDLIDRQPLRVVLDSRVRTPLGARILDDAAPSLVLVANDEADSERTRMLRAAGVEVVGAAAAPGGTGLDLLGVLKILAERQIVSVLVEGGPTVAGAFLRAGLIDRVVAYLAPVLIGGDGLPALAGPGAPNIAAALRLHLDEVTRLGPDLRLVAHPIREA